MDRTPTTLPRTPGRGLEPFLKKARLINNLFGRSPSPDTISLQTSPLPGTFTPEFESGKPPTPGRELDCLKTPPPMQARPEDGDITPTEDGQQHTPGEEIEATQEELYAVVPSHLKENKYTKKKYRITCNNGRKIKIKIQPMEVAGINLLGK